MDEKRITYKALEFIKGGALHTSDVILAFLEAGYANRGSLEQKISEVRKRRESFGRYLADNQKFYNLLSKLKKQGLISKEEKEWKLTNKGENKLEKINSKYIAKDDRTYKIVAFDIPETRKNHRYWLRESLKLLGFKMHQKSLWMGKVVVPEKFIRELKDHEIVSHVDIFEITKTGSLEELN